jgi:hypothetical protein
VALEDRALRWQQYDGKIAWAGGPTGLGAADTIAAGEYFSTQSATTSGVTLTYTYSFIAGTASGNSGGVDGTASGATIPYTLALISGAANASSQASGQTLGVSYSFVSGAATASSQATGQTLNCSYSFLPGTATGGSGSGDATANGVTIGYTYSFTPGSAVGSQQAEQPQFIGDGYKGHERASQQRLESRDRLRDIVARAYDKVVGNKTSPASPQEVPKATKSQRQNIAARAMAEIKSKGLIEALENIGDLIAQYERDKRQQLQTYDDELMMVMLLA